MQIKVQDAHIFELFELTCFFSLLFEIYLFSLCSMGDIGDAILCRSVGVGIRTGMGLWCCYEFLTEF